MTVGGKQAALSPSLCMSLLSLWMGGWIRGWLGGWAVRFVVQVMCDYVWFCFSVLRFRFFVFCLRVCLLVVWQWKVSERLSLPGYIFFSLWVGTVCYLV